MRSGRADRVSSLLLRRTDRVYARRADTHRHNHPSLRAVLMAFSATGCCSRGTFPIDEWPRPRGIQSVSIHAHLAEVTHNSIHMIATSGLAKALIARSWPLFDRPFTAPCTIGTCSGRDMALPQKMDPLPFLMRDGCKRAVSNLRERTANEQSAFVDR